MSGGYNLRARDGNGKAIRAPIQATKVAINTPTPPPRKKNPKVGSRTTGQKTSGPKSMDKKRKRDDKQEESPSKRPRQDHVDTKTQTEQPAPSPLNTLPVVVENYNPEWPAYFQKIKAVLEAYLKDLPGVSIEHVGSTSVPGLAAKPIIDIDIIVSGNPNIVTSALKKHGKIQYCGECAVVGSRVFIDSIQSPARNINIVKKSSIVYRSHFGLRTVLRNEPTLRDEYARIKLDLAARGVNADDYAEGKFTIIQTILKKSKLLTKRQLSSIRVEHVKSALSFNLAKTERLEFRELERSDLDTLHELRVSPSYIRYPCEEEWTEEVVKDHIEWAIGDRAYGPRGMLNFLVYHEGNFIGDIGGLIERRNRRADNSCEIWYAFYPEFQGKGFATEAVTKLIELFVEMEGSPLRFLIECDERNIKSAKMAKRLRFRKYTPKKPVGVEFEGEWVPSLTFKRIVR